MPTVRIPLVGSFNTRGVDGDATITASEDQRFLNATFNLVQNPVTGKAAVYIEKRPGWGVDTIVSANNPSTGLIKPQSFNATLSAFGDTDSTIYLGPTSVGTITGRALHFTETVISGVTHVMVKSSDGTGWYFAEDAADNTAYTCDTNGTTTISDLKVGGVSSVAGLYVGQAVSGTDIPAGTRISSINAGAFTAVLTAAATGTTGDMALTKTPIAKILDTDFITTGSYISAFAEMDGYLFYTNEDGYIRNSDLNSVTSYSATGFLAPNMSPDPPVAVARSKNAIIVLGQASKEVFHNAGNATGSPLQRVPQLFERIGCLDQRSVTQIENDIFFVSTPYEGDVGVYRIKDFTAQRISTPSVDRILGTASATGGAIYASSFRLGGYPYLSLFCSSATDGPSSALLLESGDEILLESGDRVLLDESAAEISSYIRTLVYNATLNIWGEWDASEATFIDSVGSGTSNQLVATSRVETTGRVYRISPAADGELYQDNGVSYSMEVRTQKLDMGTSKRKFIKEIRLVTDMQTAGTASLSYSDDDYQTWSTARTFDLTSDQPKITRVGSHKAGRAYKLTHSYNGPFRAEALEIEYEVEA